MPAAYAHYRFGGECIETMPPKIRQICLSHRDLFDLGVHGPDIFFYYDPLKSNPISEFGSEMHRHSGKEFFERCRIVYQTNPEKAEILAYMLGFLAHFSLDSSCHGYINEMTESTEISHNMIESQYDAFLMRQDGLDPLKTDRSVSLHPTRKNAVIISRFFSFTSVEVHKALKGQKTVLHLLYSPKELKKKGLRKLIAAVNLKGNFDDLFLDESELPACREMNRQIDFRRDNALAMYPELVKNLMNFMLGEEKLDEYFNHDFEGEIVAE